MRACVLFDYLHVSLLIIMFLGCLRPLIVYMILGGMSMIVMVKFQRLHLTYALSRVTRFSIPELEECLSK